MPLSPPQKADLDYFTHRNNIAREDYERWIAEHYIDAPRLGDAPVAYGQPPKPRKPRSRARWLVPAWALALPLIVAHWLLCPLWFKPAHEFAWGPVAMEAMAAVAGVLHGFALVAWLIAALVPIIEEGARDWLFNVKPKD